MQILLDRFPIFEANQVLMSGHLNNVFDYLDQQNRLTRSHLIGIGIVCGLDIKLDAARRAISLAKGCGVTSEGYLMVEPADVTLTSYRSYSLPSGEDYPSLKDVPLWELFPDGEPATTPLDSPAGFLNDKAVLLFLELKKEGLRNCSPNNCDDKGSLVVATLRRLLISHAELDKIIAAARDLGSGLTASDIDTVLSARLNLPDLRQRRFDVTNTQLVTSADVYAAFLTSFSKDQLAKATGDALNAAYVAFEPLLKKAYASNPFANFPTAFGFLDSLPTSSSQVTFLQYYSDLFDDLLKAYDEFRWQGVELICACCPPAQLFPRHLMLGNLKPATATADPYRQGFLTSPAIGGCEAETRSLVDLFARLVELTLRFTNTPVLIGSGTSPTFDPQIKMTPSLLGRERLGLRAIPYYYSHAGTPPLYALWDGEKTRRKRANRNLSYRAGEFAPPSPNFVTEPLRYDLEPYNFLRVEGHLLKNYADVVTSLNAIKQSERLPIDVIALRTGAYDNQHPVELSRETARFADLESLYDALREQLLAALAEGTREIYDMPLAEPSFRAGTSQNPLLMSYAPGFTHSTGSIGSWFENYLAQFKSMPYLEVDQNLIDATAVSTVYCILFSGTQPPTQSEKYPYIVALYYFLKLSEILPTSLDQLAYSDFENKCQDLLALLRFYRTDVAKQMPANIQTFLPQAALMELCENVLFNCQLDPIKSVHQEYLKRMDDVRKLQFLSTFLQQHPGIQHKAGVPMGGTFILVYHAISKPKGVIAQLAGQAIPAATTQSRNVFRRMSISNTVEKTVAPAIADVGVSVVNAIDRIGGDVIYRGNADIQVVLASLLAAKPELQAYRPFKPGGAKVPKIIADTIAGLDEGAVIADFFLPYRLSGSGPGISYVLPKPLPGMSVTMGCTNDDGIAAVEVNAKGGRPPYELAVDQLGYQSLAGPITLLSGSHVLRLRDTDGMESSVQTISVPYPIHFGDPLFACNEGSYVASIALSGGTPPYTVNGTVTNDIYTSPNVESGKDFTLNVLDSLGCASQTIVNHTCPPVCDLPCKGISLKRGYRFWMPEPKIGNPYRDFQLKDIKFTVESTPGNIVDLSGDVASVLKASTAELQLGQFEKLVEKWLEQINQIISGTPGLGKADGVQWLTLSYRPAKVPNGQFGTLMIEHFECLKFTFEISLHLEFAESGAVDAQFIYQNDVNAINYPGLNFKVPPLDGEVFDKCNPEKPPQPICPVPPKFELKLGFSQNGGLVIATVSTSPDTPDVSFYWETLEGNPRNGEGSEFKTELRMGTHIFNVLAVTKDGCSVTGTQTFEMLG